MQNPKSETKSIKNETNKINNNDNKDNIITFSDFIQSDFVITISAILLFIFIRYWYIEFSENARPFHTEELPELESSYEGYGRIRFNPINFNRVAVTGNWLNSINKIYYFDYKEKMFNTITLPYNVSDFQYDKTGSFLLANCIIYTKTKKNKYDTKYIHYFVNLKSYSISEDTIKADWSKIKNPYSEFVNKNIRDKIADKYGIAYPNIAYTKEKILVKQKDKNIIDILNPNSGEKITSFYPRDHSSFLKRKLRIDEFTVNPNDSVFALSSKNKLYLYKLDEILTQLANWHF